MSTSHATTGPHTSGRRHVPALLLRLAALVLAVTTITLATDAGAQEAGDPGTSAAGALELVDRSPWVDADGSLSLSVRTTGDVATAIMRVQIHAAVRSSADLDAALDGDLGRRLYASPPIPVGFVPVEADGTQRLEVAISTTTSGDLTARLRDPGVYPLTLTLEQPDGTVLTTIRTPVVRLGTDDDPLDAPHVAVVVDVGTEPSVGADGGRTIAVGDLARLARLGTFLALAGGGDDPSDAPTGPPPLSIAAVPDTIDALTASPDPRAADVLETLTALDARHLAVAMPYVDVSVQALLDADLEPFLPGLAALGRNLLDDRLTATVSELFWTPNDPLEPAGADALATLGVRHLLVDSADLTDTFGPPDDDDRRLVDAGPRPLADLRPLDAVVVDRPTSEALAAPASDGVDAPHRALADLLLRTPPTAAVGRAGDDTTRTATTVVVRFDDVPDDAVIRGLLPLLAAPGSPVTVGGLELLGAGPDLDAPDLAWEPRGPATDLRDLAPRIRAVNAEVDTFSALVVGESARAVDLRLRVATALAHGLTTDQRTALVDAAASTIEDTFAAITLSGQTDLNLTSRSGTLPLVLRNDTGFPVRVVVEIRSERLGFPDGDRFEVSLTEEITRLDVPVEARATGSVPTFVTVTTPDGAVTLDSRQLNVRSTAISGVGLFLSLGALAVLILWWGRSWWRGRSAGARTD